MTAALLLAQAGFGGAQSATSPAGPIASQTLALFWGMLAAAAAVYLLVLAAALHATFRRRREEEREAAGERARRATRWVAGAVAGTLAILFAVLVADLAVGRAQAVPPRGEGDPLTIRVVGRQWWWEVVYADPSPRRRVTTANEIHVPVGRTVLLELESRDVIHSFWPPSVRGKRDLVPGHVAHSWLRVDEPGVYRGQCAEFCGHQHAKMGFVLVAHSPEGFAAWYEAQLRPAEPPADSLAAAGERVFLTRSCVMCHTVRGTPAGGRVGPDLTHLAGRRTLAAATLANTRGALAGWITDPQRIKPGARMPATQLTPDELHALLAYLEGLR